VGGRTARAWQLSSFRFPGIGLGPGAAARFPRYRGDAATFSTSYSPTLLLVELKPEAASIELAVWNW
jgi:hypothetical protein